MLELSTILAAYQANADSAAPLQNPSFIPSLPGPNATRSFIRSLCCYIFPTFLLVGPVSATWGGGRDGQEVWVGGGGETWRGGRVTVCTMQWTFRMLLQYWGSIIISEQIQFPLSSALSETQINIPHSAPRSPLPISAPNKERIFHTQRTGHEIYHLLQRIERNCFPKYAIVLSNRLGRTTLIVMT